MVQQAGMCWRQTYTYAFRQLKRASSTSSVRPVDYDSYLSARSKARQPSAIRALQPLLAEPGMISLGGGMPHPDTFPFSSLRVGVKGGDDIVLGGSDLEEVLQYSGTRGLKALCPHLMGIQRTDHGSSPRPFEMCVKTGSQDGLIKAFDLFTADGERRLPLLVNSSPLPPKPTSLPSPLKLELSLCPPRT